MFVLILFNFCRFTSALNLLVLFILVKHSIFRSSPLHGCKISFIYVNRRPRYCCLCKNPRWRPPPSWINFCSIFWHTCL